MLAVNRAKKRRAPLAQIDFQPNTYVRSLCATKVKADRISCVQLLGHSLVGKNHAHLFDSGICSPRIRRIKLISFRLEPLLKPRVVGVDFPGPSAYIPVHLSLELGAERRAGRR